MRLLLALASLLALLLVLWLRAGAPQDVVSTLERTAAETSDEGSEPAVTPLDHMPRTEPAPQERMAATAEESPVSADTTGPRAIVFGVVANQDGVPLPDALVQLGAYPRWNERGDGGALERFGPRQSDLMHGFELRTGADGAFRFDVALAKPATTMLYVATDRFHDSFQLRFGGTNRGTRPPLTEGERDLGTIRLGPTGAIRGFVTDRSGAPLEGVVISIGESRSTTFGRYAKTQSDGSYVLAHAPVGTYGVSTKLEGYVSQFQEPVAVEAGRDAGPVDFALDTAPEISGRVVDRDGAAIGNARLWGWPKSSGSGAGGRSAADGSFTVYLPQDEPYSLEVTHPDFAKWGNSHDKDTLFTPGTADLLITMDAAQKARFLVLDGESGEPLERFGLNILEENGSKSEGRVHTERRRPRMKDRPGGVAEISGRTGVDLYVIHAEGYLLATGDVEPDEEGGDVQTVRLRRGASVTGRVMRDGAPVADAAVELVAAVGYGQRPGMFRADDNTRQRATTGADGRFAFGGARPGLHRVTVTPASGAPRVVEVPDLRPPETRDLGELVVGEGGTIDGIVLVPGGVDPAGLTVYLGEWSAENTQVTDATGRFRFTEVPLGEQTLRQGGRRGTLASGSSTKVSVQSAAAISAELDARSLGIVSIALTVELDGVPTAGIEVEVVKAGGPTVPNWREREKTHIELGETNDDGLAVGAGRAFGECEVVLGIPDVGAVRVPHQRLQLEFGQPVSDVVRLETATLVVDLGESMALPESGKLRIELDDDDEGFAAIRARLSIEDGELRSSESGFVVVDGRTVTVRGLVPGSWKLTAYAVAKDAPQVETTSPSGRTRYSPERQFEHRADVELRAGATSTVEVETR